MGIAFLSIASRGTACESLRAFSLPTARLTIDNVWFRSLRWMLISAVIVCVASSSWITGRRKRIVKRLPFPAHATETCLTPCSEQSTRGALACGRVLNGHLSRCRHLRSGVWSLQASGSEHCGQRDLVPVGWSTNTSNRCSLKVQNHTCCRPWTLSARILLVQFQILQGTPLPKT